MGEFTYFRFIDCRLHGLTKSFCGVHSSQNQLKYAFKFYFYLMRKVKTWVLIIERFNIHTPISINNTMFMMNLEIL